MSRRRGSRLLPVLAVGAAGIALAACGGGSSSSPVVFPTDPPAGGVACPALVLSGPPLVSPAPGSTGVPVSLSVLTFAMLPIPDVIAATATLSGGDGSTLTSGPLTVSPDGMRTTASIAGLQPHTTYTVKVTGTVNERGCTYAVLGNDGTFTTQ